MTPPQPPPLSPVFWGVGKGPLNSSNVNQRKTPYQKNEVKRSRSKSRIISKATKFCVRVVVLPPNPILHTREGGGPKILKFWSEIAPCGQTPVYDPSPAPPLSPVFWGGRERQVKIHQMCFDLLFIR